MYFTVLMNVTGIRCEKTVPHGSIKGLGVEGRKNIMPE
jgi:hypothetical protein